MRLGALPCPYSHPLSERTARRGARSSSRPARGYAAPRGLPASSTPGKSRAARTVAAFLTAAARGRLAQSDPTTRPRSARPGPAGGGVHSAAAPTFWPLRLQRAASGSARAGGGCYARNVRVSGSPSGSKRTTNNLSARRPPPPSASCRSLPAAPAFLRGGGAAGCTQGRPGSPVLRPRWVPSSRSAVGTREHHFTALGPRPSPTPSPSAA